MMIAGQKNRLVGQIWYRIMATPSNPQAIPKSIFTSVPYKSQYILQPLQARKYSLASFFENNFSLWHWFLTSKMTYSFDISKFITVFKLYNNIKIAIWKKWLKKFNAQVVKTHSNGRFLQFLEGKCCIRRLIPYPNFLLGHFYRIFLLGLQKIDTKKLGKVFFSRLRLGQLFTTWVLHILTTWDFKELYL